MVKKTILKKKQEVRDIQKELKALGPVMRGTVVYIGTKNKQYYFSLNKDKKTRMIYLGEKKVSKAREYVANYKKLLDLTEKMTILNMELLKEGAAL